MQQPGAGGFCIVARLFALAPLVQARLMGLAPQDRAVALALLQRELGSLSRAGPGLARLELQDRGAQVLLDRVERLERSLNDYLTGQNANLSTVLDTTLDRLKGATIDLN